MNENLNFIFSCILFSLLWFDSNAKQMSNVLRARDSLISISFSQKGKEIATSDKISITFPVEMDPSTATKISVDKNGTKGVPIGGKYRKVTGTWSTVNNKVFTFIPQKPFEPGSFIAITVHHVMTVERTHCLPVNNRNFIMFDDEKHLGYDEIILDQYKIVNNGRHILPMVITLPHKGGPFPVMFFVHGGGWFGGTPERSERARVYEARYLADHLGIAVVGISYRCIGSGGIFEMGFEDVMAAIQYIKDNRTKYNIDTNRMGLYGGSAGTPLAALAAQKVPEIRCYVGFSGIYDFVIYPGCPFIDNTQYQPKYPSAKENSPIFNLRKDPADVLLHGTADVTINPQQSILFAKKIKTAGGNANVLLYRGEPHAFFNEGRLMNIPTLYAMKEFLRKEFGINN